MIITAAISTLVSLFYYFKIPLNAFLKETQIQGAGFKVSPKSLLGVFQFISLAS